MDDLNYVTRVWPSPEAVDGQAWDALLAQQSQPTPFMRHAYLTALHTSGSASPATGWEPYVFTVHQGQALVAACVVYAKDHSYGEYVFDWAWANAYQQHGVAYYPKAVIAVPFTPVPGTRLMAVDAPSRKALLDAVLAWCKSTEVSSLHVLFEDAVDLQTAGEAGLMPRHTVQFHWHNTTPGYADFDAFLAGLTQEKRKKIRQERRKVKEAGVKFRHALGADITSADWDFFYRCYERTYLEHGNPPYLNPDFFARMAKTMPENWLLFIAERNGRPIASSLIAVGAFSTSANAPNNQEISKVAYGRYWGALESVDCLHFEACYYQPLVWCIANGYHRFEGGAQGVHKMARALLPVKTQSSHWLAHPAFADAVANFLEREGLGIGNYMNELEKRSPLKSNGA